MFRHVQTILRKVWLRTATQFFLINQTQLSDPPKLSNFNSICPAHSTSLPLHCLVVFIVLKRCVSYHVNCVVTLPFVFCLLCCYIAFHIVLLLCHFGLCCVAIAFSCCSACGGLKWRRATHWHSTQTGGPVTSPIRMKQRGVHTETLHLWKIPVPF